MSCIVKWQKDPHSYWECLFRGDVVTMDCVERLIRKNKMQCPITGKVLQERDIITIVRVSKERLRHTSK